MPACIQRRIAGHPSEQVGVPPRVNTYGSGGSPPHRQIRAMPHNPCDPMQHRPQLSEDETEEILAALATALAVFERAQSRLGSFEISVKSMLAVLRAELLRQTGDRLNNMVDVTTPPWSGREQARQPKDFTL